MARLNPFSKRPNTVAVLRLAGTIAAGSRGGLSDQSLAPLIEKAFRRGKPSAVALILNSPGGSPVQSALIGARIRRLADEKSVPVYAFVEDVAASGGYWLAAAADEIFRVLMGDQVEPRREFIEKHALDVKDLDV